MSKFGTSNSTHTESLLMSVMIEQKKCYKNTKHKNETRFSILNKAEI